MNAAYPPTSPVIDRATMAMQRSSAITGKRTVTVVRDAPPELFGFGSATPARPIEQFPDTPGPGKYDPSPGRKTNCSVRGYGNGFASKTQRKLEFTRGNANPAPGMYSPSEPRRQVRSVIARTTGRTISCYQDERESSITPGPANYYREPRLDRHPSAAFASRTKREIWRTKKKKLQHFDGKNLVISPIALSL